MRLRKTLLTLLAIIMVFGLVACGSNAKTTSTDQGQSDGASSDTAAAGTVTDEPVTLTIWSFLGSFFIDGGIADEYTKMHPNVKFEYVPIVADDLMQKITQTLASGGELPDIICYESSWWKTPIEMDLNVHLEDYGIQASDYIDSLAAPMVDSKGHVQGINYSLNNFGIAIKNDMAEKYLGTSDRDELLKIFATSDSIIDAGQKVLADTNNGVHMFGTLAFHNFWFNFQVGGACENEAGELELTKNHLQVYENHLKYWRSGIVNNFQIGGPEYNGIMNDDQTIAFVTCTGDIFYTFQPNDPEGKVALTLVPMPSDIGGANFGGTMIGVTQQSKNPDVAVDFLKYFLHDIEGVKWVRDNLGSFVPLKAAYDDPATLGKYTYKNFGDFDYGSFYAVDAAKGVKPIPYSEKDQVVRNAMSTAETALLSDDSLTAQDLMDMEIAEVKAALPDAVIK